MKVRKVKEFQDFLRFYLTPLEERSQEMRTQEQYAAATGRSMNTLFLWTREIKRTQATPKLDEENEFLKHMRELAFSSGNSKDRELYARLNGWLIEKKEETVKHELSATDYITISARVVQRLRDQFEASGGICPVCLKRKALPVEPRSHPEREHSGDGEVAALALST